MNNNSSVINLGRTNWSSLTLVSGTNSIDFNGGDYAWGITVYSYEWIAVIILVFFFFSQLSAQKDYRFLVHCPNCQCALEQWFWLLCKGQPPISRGLGVSPF